MTDSDIWLTTTENLTHIVYFGEGDYTEFLCGEEASTKSLRKTNPEDQKCPKCVLRSRRADA